MWRVVLKGMVRASGSFWARRFDRAAESPSEVQRELLRLILAANRETVFGREHGFSGLDRELYRRRVPMRDDAGFKPYIDRIARGESKVLTAEDPFLFSLTSGTNGDPKLVPITRSFHRAGARHTQLWMYLALRDHPGFLDGGMLGIVSPAVEGRTPSGIPYGSASGQIYRGAPPWLRSFYSVPYPVFEIEDYDRRYALIALFAVARDLTSAITPNPLTLVRIAEAAESHREAILRSLHDGAIDPSLVPGGEAPPLRRDRMRARELESLAPRSGRFLPRDYWPRLRLIGCWTGSSIGAHVRALRRWFGEDVPVRDIGYLASEGRMSLPRRDGTPEGVLALENNFYEFIPEEETETAHPSTLLAEELEVGRTYEVVLTTLGGLYRYRIDDLVEVTGWYRSAPQISFVRKGRDSANLSGEKIHVHHLLEAVSRAATAHHLELRAFRVVPNQGELRYDFYLEAALGAAAPLGEAALAADLDRKLAGANREYDQKRRSKRLEAPTVTWMRPGWSAARFRRDVASGKRDVQLKWKVLVEEVDPLDREWIAKPAVTRRFRKRSA